MTTLKRVSTASGQVFVAKSVHTLPIIGLNPGHHMTDALIFTFWLSTAILLYTYLGYGVLIYILAKMKARKGPPEPGDSELPMVTMVIAAYNEADYIEQKILNTLSLDYPADKLKLLIATDGSNDGTPDIVARHARVNLMHLPERRGKIHAVNRVMKAVDTPIVVFSDANTTLNSAALKNLVRHYEDPAVGGVAGEKRIVAKDADNASGSGEGLYWKYESFLKQKDSQLYAVMGAAGELFSIRTALFEEPPVNMIIEDFYMSLRIVSKGYRFIYEPDAYATETASASVGDEWKRKVRICAGGFQAITRLWPLLNPLKHGVVTFQYVSHRVLRWTLAPLSLALMLITSTLLAFEGSQLYALMLTGQLFFYALALTGYFLRERRIGIKGFFVPFYFSVMNLSVFAGFVRFLRGRQSVVWEKAARAQA
jgi:biofilm PGA synthesis N-glycosyltransferase PgaC